MATMFVVADLARILAVVVVLRLPFFFLINKLTQILISKNIFQKNHLKMCLYIFKGLIDYYFLKKDQDKI